VQSLPRLARIGSAAKSIAPCRMHLQKNQLKNLHGGLRGAMRGWCTKSLLKVKVQVQSQPRHQLRIRTSAKSSKLQRPKICMVGCDVISGVASKSLLKLRLRCKACHAE